MIKAKDLEVKFNEAALKEAAKMETEIDFLLEKNYRGVGKNITITLPTVYKQHVIDFVCERYRKEGWTVTSHCDQRDGDYLEFIPQLETDWHGH